ncbi:MAG: hypothetical protein HRT86_10280, partial [Ilumatobacteraceae bacterium]|nr:hypothetical protein [Ilumatobacteraceae bacterium]
MDFADEPVAERKALAKAREPVFQRGHVVRHFDDVVERGALGLAEFEQQEFGQG